MALQVAGVLQKGSDERSCEGIDEKIPSTIFEASDLGAMKPPAVFSRKARHLFISTSPRKDSNHQEKKPMNLFKESFLDLQRSKVKKGGPLLT